ncbi:MAG: DM13 domain-containing protein [Dehalococcoidia bacterium]
MLQRIPRSMRVLGALGGIALAVGAWWAFRPELLFVDDRVSEAFPVATASTSAGAAAPSTPAGAKVLSSGRFTGYAHETDGTATVYEVDGKRVLRLSDFRTSNGPDVKIAFVAAADVKDDATVKSAGYVNIAPMKGNVGDQNYELPADLDLSKYRTVVVWCERFAVNFGAAPLRM